jgi:hypothetical protein
MSEQRERDRDPGHHGDAGPAGGGRSCRRGTYWAVVAALAVMVLAMAVRIGWQAREDPPQPPAPELRTRVP